MRPVLRAAAALLLWTAAAPAGYADAPPKVATDWSGLWMVDVVAVYQAKDQEAPVFTPEYQAKLAVLDDQAKAGHPFINPETRCLPPGMPSVMSQPYPIEFLFAPDNVTIIQEAFSQVRTIHTDRSKFPDDHDTTFNGHSIGHWEGDTLVVETIDLNDSTFLPVRGHPAGLMPHSDAIHITEHIRKIAPDTIEDRLTLTDPKALAKPWQIRWTYIRHHDWDLREYVCEENNREAASPTGVANPVEGK